MGHVGPETVSTFLSILSVYIYNLRVVIRISVAQVSVRGSSWLWGVIIGCFPWTKVKCQILKLQIKWSCHQSADVSICLSVCLQETWRAKQSRKLPFRCYDQLPSRRLEEVKGHGTAWVGTVPVSSSRSKQVFLPFPSQFLNSSYSLLKC